MCSFEALLIFLKTFLKFKGERLNVFSYQLVSELTETDDIRKNEVIVSL